MIFTTESIDCQYSKTTQRNSFDENGVFVYRQQLHLHKGGLLPTKRKEKQVEN